jgi:hypothetical protein
VAAALGPDRDATIEDVRQTLSAQALVFDAIQRFFVRHAITKKTAHAPVQDRSDVAERREAWFARHFDLDPERLTFIDEAWASTNTARRYGRPRRGLTPLQERRNHLEAAGYDAWWWNSAQKPCIF